MKNSLNTVQRTLEQFFGILEQPRRLEGGLSHEVYSLDQAKIIVKVYSPEISADRLEVERKALKILEKSKQVLAPKIVRSKDGQYRVPINSTFLSCFKKLDGERKFLLTEAPKNLEEIAQIGRYLGLLHNELLAGAGAFAPKISPIFEVAKSIVPNALEVDRIVSELIKGQAPYFITHGDFQQSNLLYSEDSISGVIDFEYSTPDFRISDVAGCLSNLLSANSKFLKDEELISNFVDSYKETNNLPLLPVEMDALRRLIEIIWWVNLFWVESKLKTAPEEHLVLLELYKSQTKISLDSLSNG